LERRGIADAGLFSRYRVGYAAGMLTDLLPLAACAVFTRASNPRSADPVELAALARNLAPDLATAVEVRPAGALARAWRWAPRIVVAGSIFLLGHVIEELERP
jgi:folylpolyglutamate synthase/dihydropteroate synthase